MGSRASALEQAGVGSVYGGGWCTFGEPNGSFPIAVTVAARAAWRRWRGWYDRRVNCAVCAPRNARRMLPLIVVFTALGGVLSALAASSFLL